MIQVPDCASIAGASSMLRLVPKLGVYGCQAPARALHIDAFAPAGAICSSRSASCFSSHALASAAALRHVGF